MSPAPDAAALALMHPFQTGALVLPESGDLLFLQARSGPVLTLAARERWHCEQGHRAQHSALLDQQVRVEAEIHEGRYAAVLCLPPRQREQARAQFARALALVEPGGLVVAAMTNDEGARSGESDLKALAGSVASLSKHKCRVFWTRRGDAAIDAERQRQWLALDQLQPIVGGRYLSRPGLFAWDRIDPASALLVANLPPTLAGSVGDLGAGWGYLSCEVAQRCPQVQSLHLYEVQARALPAARANLERHAGAVPFELHWHDVTAGLPHRHDVIVCNPPFHEGRAGQPELGQRFLRAAAAGLTARGQLWLVANRHLPYEATLAEAFREVRTVARGSGFKLLHASEPRR